MTIRTDAGNFDTDHLVQIERQENMDVWVWLDPSYQAGNKPPTADQLEKATKLTLSGQAAIQAWVQVNELAELVEKKPYKPNRRAKKK